MKIEATTRIALQIRAAKPEDAERILGVHLSSIRSLCAPHYKAAVIAAWTASKDANGYLPGIQAGATLVAECDSRIVGFCEAVPGKIHALYVDPGMIRRGVGSALLRHAMRLAQPPGDGTVWLEATLNAVPFYERAGFRELRRSALLRNGIAVPVVVMAHGAT